MERIYLNNDWQFSEVFDEAMIRADFKADGMTAVRIPHTCRELPYNYFDEKEYQMVSGYRRILTVPEDWKGHKLLLTFEGVGHYCEVYLNGTIAGTHNCGYSAFTLDISDLVSYGEDNLIALKVDSREELNTPPFGFVIDYMTYGGIYRDVYLEVKNPTYIKDIFHHASLSPVKLTSEIEIEGYRPGLRVSQEVRFVGNIASSLTPNDADTGKAGGDHLHHSSENNNIEAGKEHTNPIGSVTVLANQNIDAPTSSLITSIDNVSLWSPEEPNLYEITTTLLEGEEILDSKVVTFGFRQAEFKRDGFYLNGSKYLIRGLNRHQCYPYVGYAMPKSMQDMDASVLKYELGVNAVRTSHYPQSQYFIDACDRLGLLVFTEIPGWQHIGDEAWKEQAITNVRDMVLGYRNHPSIIIWGVRINESADDEEFYAATNAMAHSLDPTRPTGGVRTYKKGIFQEDVYTYNDFSHEGHTPGCLPKKKVSSDVSHPYLVTEYNGHMYPTKAFDCEDHRVEHAIRHANVLDAIAGEKDICGSFGWCMADYNTHKDFGSGDRICYHGVLDMFRNPKLAASVYQSQQEDIPVLTVSSNMDIGEHPACNRENTWIMTNADSVRMYKNNEPVKEYFPSDSPYKSLAHGPILVDDYVGDVLETKEHMSHKKSTELKEAMNYVARFGQNKLPLKLMLTALKAVLVYHMTPDDITGLYTKYVGDWGGESTTYRFDAIRDGRVVKSVTKSPMTELILNAKADHTVLNDDYTYDVAAIRISATDENGNLLNYFNEPVSLSAEGPIEIIGPKLISLKGGMFGTYVKTVRPDGMTGTCSAYSSTGSTGAEGIVEQSGEQTSLPARLTINTAGAKALTIDFTVNYN